MKASTFPKILAIPFFVLSTVVFSHPASGAEEYPLDVATQATVLTPISEDSTAALEHEKNDDYGSQDRNSSKDL